MTINKIYETLLTKRLNKYKIRSDFFDAGDSIVVEAYGPRILYKKKPIEYSTKSKMAYIFGIFKNSSTFFVVNPYTNTKTFLPYETKQQAESFGKICRKIFKEKYIPKKWVSKRGLGKKKKNGPKKKKTRPKDQRDDYSLTIDDWVFLYFIYGEDIYDLSLSQLRSVVVCKGYRNFTKNLLNRQDKHAQVCNLLYNVSPFQDLSKLNGQLWATPYEKERRVKVAGKRIEKAKKILDGRRWIPPKTRVLIKNVNLKNINGSQTIENYCILNDLIEE